MIDAAGKGMYFYRLIVSPDRDAEDARTGPHLRRYRKDHATFGRPISKSNCHLSPRSMTITRPLRHVHMLALLPGRLNSQDLAALRGIATEAALFSAAGAGSGPGAADPRAAIGAHATAAEGSPSGATTLKPASPAGTRCRCRLEARAGQAGDLQGCVPAVVLRLDRASVRAPAAA